MGNNKKIPIASREEIQEFFEEEQRAEDEQKRKNVAEEGQKKEPFSSADIERLIQSSNEEFMDWFYSTLPPQNTQVDVNPTGGPAKRKSSNSKGRKKRKRRKYRENDPWIIE